MSEPERMLQPAGDFIKALVKRCTRPAVGGGRPWIDWQEVDASMVDWMTGLFATLEEERNKKP